MTKLQDAERGAKTLADNERWLAANADKTVRRNESEATAHDRWDDEGGSAPDGSQQCQQ